MDRKLLVKPNNVLKRGEYERTHFMGYLLLFTTYLCFMFFAYSMVISKFMPHTGNKILDWMKEDDYYVYLVPLTLPVLVFVVTLNWMGMKFFRHN